MRTVALVKGKLINLATLRNHSFVAVPVKVVTVQSYLKKGNGF